MKYLFLVFLLANLALFLWEYTHRPAGGEEAYPPPGAQRLRLLSERDAPAVKPAGPEDGAEAAGSGADDAPPQADAAERVARSTSAREGAGPSSGQADAAPSDTPAGGASSSTTSAGGSPGGTSRCFSLGPYFDPARAEALAAALRARGLTVERRRGRAERLIGHWVYIPPVATREAAQRVTGDLTAHGVEDYYIVTDDERENAISVGLFSQQASVERRTRQLKALGYDTRVEPRYSEATAYWLDYARPAEDAVPTSLWRTPDQQPPPERRARECGAQ